MALHRPNDGKDRKPLKRLENHRDRNYRLKPIVNEILPDVLAGWPCYLPFAVYRYGSAINSP